VYGGIWEVILWVWGILGVLGGNTRLCSFYFLFYIYIHFSLYGCTYAYTYTYTYFTSNSIPQSLFIL
jgi:hypothetical protein